jgi:hypothetical protein
MIRVTLNGEKMFRCVKCDYATRQLHRAEPVRIYPLAHERMKARKA